jgi:hypothetical protein
MNISFRKLLRQSPPPIVSIIWAALIFSLIAFLFWVNREVKQEENERATLIYQLEGMFDRPTVADCLTRKLPLTGRNWKAVNHSGSTWRRDNAARHLRVDIVDMDDRHRIDIFTRDAQPLRAQEIKAVRLCIGLPAGQK